MAYRGLDVNGLYAVQSEKEQKDYGNIFSKHISVLNELNNQNQSRMVPRTAQTVQTATMPTPPTKTRCKSIRLEQCSPQSKRSHKFVVGKTVTEIFQRVLSPLSQHIFELIYPQKISRYFLHQNNIPMLNSTLHIARRAWMNGVRLMVFLL